MKLSYNKDTLHNLDSQSTTYVTRSNIRYTDSKILLIHTFITYVITPNDKKTRLIVVKIQANIFLKYGTLKVFQSRFYDKCNYHDPQYIWNKQKFDEIPVHLPKVLFNYGLTCQKTAFSSWISRTLH